MKTERLVVFAHGKESGPWGTKIQRLADIASAKGFDVESPDYTGVDDPEQRCQQLLDFSPRASRSLVLVGSSMGAYVSAAASETLKPNGLFLLAPAVLIDGFGRKDLKPLAQVKSMIHAWQDEVIPVGHAIDFAQQHGFDLHLYDSDHRLISVLNQIAILFDAFLETVLQRENETRC